ncbi:MULTISPECIES: phosphatase PAP2 family protein [unclassified Arthrobacter]|uniref:phosphatase PAP2 family protein n=1 Tax=unclassified Arthrobacter TaxID=235627 RepID=UPI00159DB5F6|nr:MULTISPECIES: phosphatase PAP2 family protein [unclassified Arthrobacter]MCQ9165102.1 phosphatase PAP2 family protein [Arthrobacter sp. STN4]NVN00349.1 phosphatase PAP2 family protein [Arthrobacter sp. SDTb3-6]
MSTHAPRSPRGSSLPRRTRIHSAPFIAGALVSLAGLVACYKFFVDSTVGQFMDESALVQAKVAQRFIGLPAAGVLDLLPATSVVIAVVVVLFVTLARRRWKASGVAVLAMAAANLSTQLIKIGLPDRPFVGVQTLTLNSLPSGHSTLAASAAAAVFLVVSPRWRPSVAFVGGSYAVVAGVATLINQWHRPADVIAAFFVVAFWTCLAALPILRTGSAWNVWPGPGHHWASRRWWTGLSAVVAVAAAASTALVLRAVSTHPHDSVISFFLAGVGLIVVAGYSLTVLGTFLLTLQVRRRSRL